MPCAYAGVEGARLSREAQVPLPFMPASEDEEAEEKKDY
jgi:hypothetical protein